MRDWLEMVNNFVHNFSCAESVFVLVYSQFIESTKIEAAAIRYARQIFQDNPRRLGKRLCQAGWFSPFE